MTGRRKASGDGMPLLWLSLAAVVLGAGVGLWIFHSPADKDGSALDSGQDLPALKRWLDDNNRVRQPQYVIYDGGGNPKASGIDNDLPELSQGQPALAVPTVGLLGSLLGQGPLLAATSRIPGEYPELPRKLGELKPGLYCISATYFQGVDKPAEYRRWSEASERLYQEGMVFRWQYDHRFDYDTREFFGPYDRDGSALKLVEAYYELRLARLILYLREQKPMAKVENSILVFELTEDELTEALRPLLLPE